MNGENIKMYMNVYPPMILENNIRGGYLFDTEEEASLVSNRGSRIGCVIVYIPKYMKGV